MVTVHSISTNFPLPANRICKQEDHPEKLLTGNIPSKKNSIEYTYDDNGRLTKQTEISGDGKRTSSTKFDRNGNKFVTTVTQNDKGENETDVQFLDSSGKPIEDSEFGASKFHVNRGESNTAIAKACINRTGL